MVDSSTTKHIFSHKSVFFEYLSVREWEELVYLGDFDLARVMCKGKVLLKLTFEKILSLSNRLHISNIICNFVSIYVVGKAGVNVSFGRLSLRYLKMKLLLGRVIMQMSYSC